jgi:hypothetical protein
MSAPYKVPPEVVAEILLAGVSATECREAAVHYRAVAEKPENAGIREQILKIAGQFEERGNPAGDA